MHTVTFIYREINVVGCWILMDRKSLVKSYYIEVKQFNTLLNESQFVLSVLSVLALSLSVTERNRRIREFDGHGLQSCATDKQWCHKILW